MADHYAELTEGEQCYWNCYCRLRQLADWPGFTQRQKAAKDTARTWLVERRKEIWRLAQPTADGGDGNGWDHADRRERYEQLKDESLNGGTPRSMCALPTADYQTDFERVTISEREMWWNNESADEWTKAARQGCTDDLVAQRKEVWHLGEEEGWNENNRDERYDDLCVATKYGTAYSTWQKGHNDHTGEPVSDGGDGGWRDKSAKWHESHLGITESPANSNCDSRSDGIRTSQDGCANGTWLRNQPWCGCWAWSGLFAAGKVSKGASWLASCASIEDYARAGKAPFKGWTTDGSKAKKGDLVILFGRGQHVGTVRATPTGSTCPTWEGNTSSSNSGSQSNGGGSYKRDRSRSGEVYGYALVKD